jgi:hypothetical protein
LNSFTDAPSSADAGPQLARTPTATNGDEDRYADKSATYTKGLLQDAPCLVNPTAFNIVRRALGSSDGAIPGTGDFESLPPAGSRRLNNPLAALAAPSAATQIPPPPALAGETAAAELIELYWAALLRDIPFTEYANSDIAAAAAAELSALPAYQGPRDRTGQVTPALLFRGGAPASTGLGSAATAFAGEAVGPYVSQLALQPTMLGAQTICQMIRAPEPRVDFMTDITAWAMAQNGVPTGSAFRLGAAPSFPHTGRGLAAATQQHEFCQPYLNAYLVLKTLGIAANPGVPYAALERQQGFASFGDPDITTTLAAVARAALNAAWHQKWIVHLRHRPESAGGLVELLATGRAGRIEARLSDTALNARAIQHSRAIHGSHLLPQAFPDGAPAHPAYPSGHGAVAGACITVLKFFFDGHAPITAPIAPARDGMSLRSYTEADRDALTVNGELHKLAHNIAFGHGLHAGINWRSDADAAIRLGEAVALTCLRNQALTYRESFAVQLKCVDGPIRRITNERT